MVPLAQGHVGRTACICRQAPGTQGACYQQEWVAASLRGNELQLRKSSSSLPLSHFKRYMVPLLNRSILPSNIDSTSSSHRRASNQIQFLMPTLSTCRSIPLTFKPVRNTPTADAHAVPQARNQTPAIFRAMCTPVRIVAVLLVVATCQLSLAVGLRVRISFKGKKLLNLNLIMLEIQGSGQPADAQAA